MTSKYNELASINVGDKIEKKNGLSYLSWAWAVDQLLRADPSASWSYNAPTYWGETVMVSCTVTAFDKPMTMQLPVMNHRNQAIASPDAFAVNTAMQRCLVKAIALHGLGLYIYAGEDIPPSDDGNKGEDALHTEMLNKLKESASFGTKALEEAYLAIPKSDLKADVWKKHGAELKALAGLKK